MKTQELRTLAKKAETQPEIVVRKAEKNLRQTENSQFKLRLFRVYQLLTSISQQKLNFLKQPLHTTIVYSADLSLLLFPLARAARTAEGEGRQSQHHASRFLKTDLQPVDFTIFHLKLPSPKPRVSSPPFAKRTSLIGQLNRGGLGKSIYRILSFLFSNPGQPRSSAYSICSMVQNIRNAFVLPAAFCSFDIRETPVYRTLSNF